MASKEFVVAPKVVGLGRGADLVPAPWSGPDRGTAADPRGGPGRGNGAASLAVGCGCGRQSSGPARVFLAGLLVVRGVPVVVCVCGGWVRRR